MDEDYKTYEEDAIEEIAVIGLSGRFPGAGNIDRFWQNLCSGVESIVSFSDHELAENGMPASWINDPNFIKRGTILEDFDKFDAPFFGYSPVEAESIDPQQRIFLETCWEALENAGYNPETYEGAIGVFAGSNTNHYKELVIRCGDGRDAAAAMERLIGNEKDFLCTRVSYKLNLRGPSVTVQTGCSTSLVAVHMACQNLLSYQCTMALAGGVTINLRQRLGYFYQDGTINSPDGHCRAFDAKAQGTVLGQGVGVVVLKRLSEAIADGDPIYAVIKATAINNDGALKAGYTAPSVSGQAEVVAMAQALAGISAETISYIEAHGTGTKLGDPIEIAALTQVFRAKTQQKKFCAIGSVKTNIGHADIAAGIAGLIKTILMLKHKQIPPSLNYTEPNPEIDFENSPFFVATELSDWNTHNFPLRAGVSAFGIGGTNVHAVLEEPPAIEDSGTSRPYQIITLSARTEDALAQNTKKVASYLENHPEIKLPDAAYTLQTGRKVFHHRCAVVCRNIEDAALTLEGKNPGELTTGAINQSKPAVAFMFSGQGSQYVGMTHGLYQSEIVYRNVVDECFNYLASQHSIHLRQTIFPSGDDKTGSQNKLNQTAIAQPALFVIEYALAKLWMSWGLHPQAMIGHSIGEYVAACLAGVLSIEDALSLVVHRSQLMQSLPAGSMLAIHTGAAEIQQELNHNIDIAAINSPNLVVVSGTIDAIDDFSQRLTKKGIDSRILHTSHAFHSRMMEPITDAFTAKMGEFALKAPQIPYLSNVTGQWITGEQATSRGYWADHLRQTVQFSKGLCKLMNKPDCLLLEVGPGQTLSMLAKQHQTISNGRTIVSSTRHPLVEKSDVAFILDSIGKLYVAGCDIDWEKFYQNEKRHRISLPAYSFERKRYWVRSGEADRQFYPQTVPLNEAAPMLQICGHENSEPSADGRPLGKTEKTILNLWQEVIGLDDIGLQDNFFELGGSSLIAARMMTKLSKIYGQNLSPSIIFQFPTIGQLADFIDDNAVLDKQSALVKIQKEGKDTPFFCIPGNLGNVYMDLGFLSNHFGHDRPFYGLQDDIDYPSAVKPLAALYLKDLLEVQPTGPYFIGGICSGGVVAFEIAQQIMQRGQEVSMLALIEPASLCLPGSRSYMNLVLDVKNRFLSGRRRKKEGDENLTLGEKWIYFRLRMKVLANIWALKHYKPHFYPGRLGLFLTRESIDDGAQLEWRKFASAATEVLEIPGTHRSITGDNEDIVDSEMKRLAGLLRHCIESGLS